MRVNRLDMVATLLDLGLDPDESVVTDDGYPKLGHASLVRIHVRPARNRRVAAGPRRRCQCDRVRLWRLDVHG